MAGRTITRRGILSAGAVAAAAPLAGCDAFDDVLRVGHPVRGFLEGSANTLSYRVHRFLIGGTRPAQEFTEADISQPMRPNGVTRPDDADYKTLAEAGFADWRLEVGGLVDRPLSLSLPDLKAMPARTQITRHDCVEGWSCIAKWTGVPLAHVLGMAGVKAQARFVVFRCMDTIERSLSGAVRYYESIDLVDARHPQTILAYGMNGADVPVENGAPLRLRVERQLGYKMAKYLRSIELVADLSALEGGKGGYWEDRGYEWYAGI
jgi:DMSO/TMAO reductase YedYZ molybdopterin-dependent catalytic subunit